MTLGEFIEENSKKYRIKEIKKRNKQKLEEAIAEYGEETREDQVERAIEMSKVGAMIFGVSALAIAAINIDAAARGVPLDSIKNLVSDGIFLLSGGAGLKEIMDNVKELGSYALENAKDEMGKKR